MLRLDISQDNINITNPGYYEIYGNTTKNNIYINCQATIVLEDIDINLKECSKGAIIVDRLSTLTLVIRGDNNLKSGDNYAGIQMNGNCILNIESEHIDDTLNIESGTSGAGIGGGFGEDFAGSLTIISGNINIISTREGAGIGGGNGCNGKGDFSGTLKIEGGVINIRTGFSGGAGIGGGYSGNLRGRIDIDSGDTTIKSEENGLGAGIGGGYDGDLEGIVTINDGILTAYAGKGGAGIGGGIGIEKGGNLTGSVIINGGLVKAIGGKYTDYLSGAGIGSGYNGTFNGKIILNSGNITSVGLGSANDIGAGSEGKNEGEVNIKVESIDIIPTYMELHIGESKSINSTIVLSPEIHARVSDYTKKIYISNSSDIANVDSNGVVTATGSGEAEIIVMCEADKSKKSICKVTVRGEVINIGEINLLIPISKNFIEDDDIENIICYGNNPIINNICVNSEIKTVEEKIYIDKCKEYITAKVDYKKVNIFLDIVYSIVLLSGKDYLNNMKIYAMQNSELSSCISFCISKEATVELTKRDFEIALYPKYEIDNVYSREYYLFKIKGKIAIIVKKRNK